MTRRILVALAFAVVPSPITSWPNSIHDTFGAGVTISRRFDANVGADLATRARQISASTVFRFRR
jgi:hypothetical protein